jgi:hypothetical protein
MNMGWIEDEIIGAIKRILEYFASGNMSDTLSIIINICTYKPTDGVAKELISHSSQTFFVLGLMATLAYGIYQIWFGDGIDKLKEDATNVYQNRKIQLAAVLGGPELYLAIIGYITDISQFILGSTNVLIIFKLATITNPIAVFLQFIFSIPFAIAAYIYQYVLSNGYDLYRPLAIFLLFYPNNGLANKVFRIINYNMLYSLVITLMLYTLDNQARHGGSFSNVAWVSIPFFSIFCFLSLKYLYKYAWDPVKTKKWFEDTIKETPARTKNSVSKKASDLYKSISRRIRKEEQAPAADNKPQQTTDPQVETKIPTRRK